MRKGKFALKCNYLRLSCLKSKTFIKKTGGNTVFSFISTKEDVLLSFSHLRGKIKGCRGSVKAKYKSLKRGKGDKIHLQGRMKIYVQEERKANASKFSTKHKLILLLSGGIIGLINGFFGGGGGMICVPILQKVLHLESKKAHATAIAVIFPLSLVSAFIYVINGSIKTLPLITVGLGVVLGGLLGAFALKILPPKVVQILFAILMFVGGIKLIL